MFFKISVKEALYYTKQTWTNLCDKTKSLFNKPLSHRELYCTVRSFRRGPIDLYTAASRPAKSATVALYKLPSVVIT